MKATLKHIGWRYVVLPVTVCLEGANAESLDGANYFVHAPIISRMALSSANLSQEFVLGCKEYLTLLAY